MKLERVPFATLRLRARQTDSDPREEAKVAGKTAELYSGSPLPGPATRLYRAETVVG